VSNLGEKIEALKKEMKKVVEQRASKGHPDKTKAEIKQEQRNFAIKSLLAQKRVPFQGVGAGLHNDEMYYGTTIYNDSKELTAIVTSEKKIYIAWSEEKDEIKNKFGLNYRFPFFGDLLKYDWSYKSINRFLYDKPEDSGIKKAFDMILKKQKHFVWHPDPGYHETIACSILSTYFIPVFASKGRDLFNAELESGKTQQMNVYAGLAFHPVFSGNISGASIYRIIESVKPTSLTDDFDKVPDEQKTSFDQSYRTGYKKGMKAIRSDDKRPMGFDLYAHQVVNNIGGLDDVSESRSCKHTLMKCPETFNAPEIENEIDKWHEERDLLYTCGLLHWKEVQEAYNSLKETSLKNRALEIDKANLAIAKLAGVYDKVLGYITANNVRRKMQDLGTNWFYQVLVWWKDHAIDKWTSAATAADGIVDVCIDLQADSPYYKKERRTLVWHIGKFLGRYPIIKSKMSRGTKQYFMTEKVWRQVVRARGFEQVFNLSDLCPPPTPHTPQQPPTPLTPLKKGGNGVDGWHERGKVEKKKKPKPVPEVVKTEDIPDDWKPEKPKYGKDYMPWLKDLDKKEEEAVEE
jgi:hypothetical protein